MISPFKSYMPGELWPAFMNPKGSQTLALLYQFEKSQYLPPEEILEKQFRQLNEICVHSIKTVPYYRKKLKEAGLRRSKKVTPDKWSRVPILSRRTVQQQHKELQSRNIPKGHGRLNEVKTSGSTGLPIKVAGTDVTQFFYRACALRDHFWHKRDFSKKMAAIRVVPGGKADYPGSRSRNWGIVVNNIIETGPAAILHISIDLSKQAEFLLREQPGYLISFSSNLEALAKYFMQEGLKLDKLLGVRSFGETLGSEVRETCRQAWNVPLVDIYTAQEVGYIALQCPENEDIYHIQAENLFVEVVDDDGQPCSPGEVGRVLLTTLHNFAMPLIRYDIGDYAEVGGLCSCGRTLPVLSRIKGRQRNMLILPDGKKFWPTISIARWGLDFPVLQYQFIQKSTEIIEARLVAKRVLSPEEESSLIKILQEKFLYPFRIDIKYLDTIPRSKGGKFEDFISEVA